LQQRGNARGIVHCDRDRCGFRRGQGGRPQHLIKYNQRQVASYHIWLSTAGIPSPPLPSLVDIGGKIDKVHAALRLLAGLDPYDRQGDVAAAERLA
jgi:hypothetical protein